MPPSRPIISQSEPAVASLTALASEFETKAQAAEREALQAAVEKQEATESAPDLPNAAMEPPEPDQSGE